MHAEQKEAPVLRRAEPEKMTGVVLLMDNVVGILGADGVSEHPARAMLVVEPDVEKPAAVGCPFQRSIIVGDAGLDERAGISLDDVDRVELRAFGVDGVSD